MKALNLSTLILTILAGLDVGIAGLANIDILATIFGGAGTVLTRIIFVILGLCALWQLVPLVQSFKGDEVSAQRHTHA
ncbi:MAG TPA: DUF378 domain-containing protein [Devosia sp.]|nr:DUF378 domain-containing protein [Devosia sp.]